MLGGESSTLLKSSAMMRNYKNTRYSGVFLMLLLVIVEIMLVQEIRGGTSGSFMSPANRVAADQVGSSLDISSDGSTIFVGAYGKNSYAGSIYAYKRSSQSYVVGNHSATIYTYSTSTNSEFRPTDLSAGDEFGRSVSVSNDGTTVISGANSQSLSPATSFSECGSAYIFALSGSTYTQQVKLTASDKCLNCYYGYSVAMSGNALTAAVGAVGKTVAGATDAGSVYVYKRANTGQAFSASTETQITLPTTLCDLSCSSHGRCTLQNGVPTCLCSQNYYGVSCQTPCLLTCSGEGYCYFDSNNIATCKCSNSSFTGSDCSTPNTCVDKTKLCVHGTCNREVVYYTNETACSEVLTLNETDGTSYNTTECIDYLLEHYGDVCTCDSGYMGNSCNVQINPVNCTLQCGSYGYCVNNGGVQSCYCDTGYGGANCTTYIASHTPVNYDYFGWSVALSSDGNTLAVGAQGRDVNGYENAGTVYVMKYSSSKWSVFQALQASDYAAWDQFGQNVVISSDGSIILVGVMYKSSSTAKNCGCVYVFKLDPTFNNLAYTQVAQLWASDGTDFDYFGHSVSISLVGSVYTIAVGAFKKSGNTGDFSGAVYTFTSTDGSSWTQTNAITAADAQAHDDFGFSVALAKTGNLLAIGAYGKSVNNYANSGAVYLTHSSTLDLLPVTSPVFTLQFSANCKGGIMTFTISGTTMSISLSGPAGTYCNTYVLNGAAIASTATVSATIPNTSGMSLQTSFAARQLSTLSQTAIASQDNSWTSVLLFQDNYGLTSGTYTLTLSFYCVACIST